MNTKYYAIVTIALTLMLSFSVINYGDESDATTSVTFYGNVYDDDLWWGDGYVYLSSGGNNTGTTTDYNDVSMTITAGNSITFHAVPDTGFDFYKWIADGDDPTDPAESTSASYTITVPSNYDPDVDDITRSLRAVFVRETYTVTFDANGAGATVDPSTMTIYYGSYYGGWVPDDILPVPVRSGYIFTGWYTSASGGTEVRYDTPVSTTGDRTLYAHWASNNTYYYPTVYKGNWGSFEVYNLTTNQTLGTYTSSDHQFTILAGTTIRMFWYGSSATSGSGTNTTGQPYTYTTTYTNYEYEYSTSMYGTSAGTGDATISSSSSYYPSSQMSSTTTYYYQYTIVYNVNGGTGTIANTTDSTNSTTFYDQTSRMIKLRADTPTRSGYVFLGWALSSNATNPSYLPDTYYTFSYGTTTLYAVWDTTQRYTATIHGPFIPGITLTLSASGYETQTKTDGDGKDHIALTVRPNEEVTFTASVQNTAHTYEFREWWIEDGSPVVTNPYTITMTSNVVAWPVYDGVDMIVTFDPNGGTVYPTSKGVMYNTNYGELPTPTNGDLLFLGWYTSASGGTLVTSSTMVTETSSHTLYAHWDVLRTYWSNNLYNGSISMAFKFSGTSNMAHDMTIPLYTGTVNDREETTWNESNYTLNLSVSYNGSNTTITSSITTGITPGTPVERSMGNWSGFVLDINLSTGSIAFTPMDTFTDFTNYTTIDNQKTTVFTWDETDNATAYVINHSDSGTGNKARFSVVNTWTFLNTFGVVLNNPSINVYSYFPQYEQVRVNIYAFAVYGESMTINGKSWDVTGSTVTIYYVEDGSGGYEYATQSTEGAQSKNLTLSNIFITWDGTNCYLTFDNDNFTVNLGTYSNGSETISFTGLWYFTISLMEPYTATKTVVSGDWDSMLNIDSSAILLIFLGVMVLTGLFCHMKLGLKWLDIVIVVISMIVAFTMLG